MKAVSGFLTKENFVQDVTLNMTDSEIRNLDVIDEILPCSNREGYAYALCYPYGNVHTGTTGIIVQTWFWNDQYDPSRADEGLEFSEPMCEGPDYLYCFN